MQMVVGNLVYYLRMIVSELALPAEASNESRGRSLGFAQEGNRYPPWIKSGAGFFGIML
jgi:hypothetical protein